MCYDGKDSFDSEELFYIKRVPFMPDLCNENHIKWTKISLFPIALLNTILKKNRNGFRSLVMGWSRK